MTPLISLFIMPILIPMGRLILFDIMELSPAANHGSPEMLTLLKRDNAFTLFRSLNTAVLNNYVSLKNSFRDGAPPPHEILSEFRVKYERDRNGRNP
jgi:hypothetical protein